LTRGPERERACEKKINLISMPLVTKILDLFLVFLFCDFQSKSPISCFPSEKIGKSQLPFLPHQAPLKLFKKKEDDEDESKFSTAIGLFLLFN